MPAFDKWVEVMGFHYRTDHDLGEHAKLSGESLKIPMKDYVPHVLELSFGVDRCVLALLDTAYREEGERQWFALSRLVAPWDAGVYPLINKEQLPERAREVQQLLKLDGLKALYDSGGSIGKRYARADEIGVPYGITVDFDTLKDESVTVRDRDTTKQKRVKISELLEVLK
jgi:glycyl-tRNA synthetase